jgi:hypothetical protein
MFILGMEFFIRPIRILTSRLTKLKKINSIRKEEINIGYGHKQWNHPIWVIN